MILIQLEDVQNILSKTSDKYQSEYTWWWIAWKIRDEINSLPSIDPQEIIREMIEELSQGNITPSEWQARIFLEEALSRITLTK